MKYIIDIDGTICSKTDGQYELATPIRERIEKINSLYESGDEIVYFTARGGTSGIDWTTLTKKQLSEWGCLYHHLVMKKPSYDIWVDDKAINSEEFFK